MWEDINGYKYAETLYDPGADKFLTKAEYLEMRVADPGFFIVVYMPPRKEWMKYRLTIPHMVVASDAMQGVDSRRMPFFAGLLARRLSTE